MSRYPQSQVDVERELLGVRPSGGTAVIACGVRMLCTSARINGSVTVEQFHGPDLPSEKQTTVAQGGKDHWHTTMIPRSWFSF